MTLDLPTVVALTALSAFLMGASISLASQTQSNSDPSMKSLGWGCLAQSLGWVLIGLRDQIPDGASVFGGNLALLFSGLLYLQAVSVWDEGSPPLGQRAPGLKKIGLRAACWLYLLALFYLSFVDPNIAARIVATSLIHGYINFLCVVRLLRGTSIPKSQRVVGIGFGLVVLLQPFRIVMVLLDPPRSADLLTMLTSQTATLIFGHIAVVMLTFLFVLMVHDRTARELRDLVTQDYLTGIFNRSAFEGFARQAIEQARRSGEALSLLLFDVDHFKTINDTLGHPAGDVALRTLADLSAQKLRAQDVFGRYGGEEFAILLPATDAEGAFLVAERIRESVASTEFRDESTIFALTVSIGIAQLAPEGSTPTEKRLTDLFRAADTALYRAKRAGRNRTLIAAPEAAPEEAPEEDNSNAAPLSEAA